jgi:hypothetical protein
MFCFHVPAHLQGKDFYEDTHSFVSALREAKFFGVPSCVFDKLECAVGEKMLRNTVLDQHQGTLSDHQGTLF